MHGVVVDYNTLPGGSEPTYGYDQGDNAAHETGHYLGLFHTWQGGCTDPEGDCVFDTAPHPQENHQCPIGADTCGEPGGPDDPIHNFMNYTSDVCRDEFTDGQFARMDRITAGYKPVLASGQPPPLILDEPTVWGTGTSFEGEQIYVLAGENSTVTIPQGVNVVLDADAQGNPSTLFVNGTLYASPYAGSGYGTITLLGGSEVICRQGSNCYLGDLTASGNGASGSGTCILAHKGATIHLGGTSTFTDGGFFAIKGGTFVLEAGAEIVVSATANAPQVEPGSSFLLGSGARVAFQRPVTFEGTAAEPVAFARLAPSQAWDRLLLGGAGSTLEYVVVEGATVGIDLRATGALLDHVTLTGNGTGLRTDYVAGSGQATRSSFTLINSTVEDSGVSSGGVGVYARHTDGDIRSTTITGSGGHGLLVEDADVAPFTDNTVTGNGVSNGQAGSYAGVAAVSGGAVTFGRNCVGLAPCDPAGRNAVMNNVHHETASAAGGILAIGGTSIGGTNSIYKAAGPSAPNQLYVRNNSGLKVWAEDVWWGAAPPPSGAFSGSVDATPYLGCDWDASPPTCFHGRLASAEVSAGEAAGTSQVLGTPTDIPTGEGDQWLREEIRRTREALTLAPGAPGAPGLVRALAGLQRLDPTDALGEYRATWAALAQLRQRLVEPGAHQPAASAALVASVAEGLHAGDYDGARALLAELGAFVIDEGDRQALDLSEAALSEQAGDYAAALTEVTGVQAGLGEGEELLAEALRQVAAAITSRLMEETGVAPAGLVLAEAGVEEVPAVYALGEAYPNPFTGHTAVPFALPEAARVEITVYDLLGRRVAVLADGSFEAGPHEAILDGERFASGVYVVRAVMAPEDSAGTRTFTRRVTVLQ